MTWLQLFKKQKNLSYQEISCCTSYNSLERQTLVSENYPMYLDIIYHNVKLFHMTIEQCLICIFTAKRLPAMTARHFPKVRKILHLNALFFIQINRWKMSVNEKMVFKIACKINFITRLFGRMPAKTKKKSFQSQPEEG